MAVSNMNMHWCRSYVKHKPWCAAAAAAATSAEMASRPNP